MRKQFSITTPALWLTTGMLIAGWKVASLCLSVRSRVIAQNTFCCFCIGISLLLSGNFSIRANDALHVFGKWSVKGMERLNEEISDQDFEVFVDGDNYFLGIVSRKARSPYYAITTSDGQDSFVIQYPVAWKKPNQILPEVPSTHNFPPTLGYVYPGFFPTNQTLAAQIAWLAYVLPLQKDFQISTNCNLPFGCLVDDKSAPVDAFVVESQYTGASGKRVLQSLKFYHPGKGVRKDSKVQYDSMYEAYISGWLYAEFRINQWKMLKSREVPLQFYFKTYLPKQSGNPTNRDDVDFFEEWQFVASDMDEDASVPSIFPPKVANVKIIVTDHRLRDEFGEPYGFQLGPDGQFMHRDSQEFESIAKQLGMQTSGNRQARHMFLPIFFLFVAIPGVLLFIAYRRNKRTT